MIDRSLINKVGEGDEKAFTKIFLAYSTKLIIYVDSFINNREDAEDIVMELFEELPNLINNHYNERGNFNSWIYKIAKNRSLDCLRKSSKNIEVPLDNFKYETKRGFRIEELKDVLTEEEFRIIVMKYSLKFTEKEIANELNRTKYMVKKLISKTYEKIEEFYLLHY